MDFGDLDQAPLAETGLGSVPVIDLSGGLTPQTVEAIARACRDWGFFQVTGHSVDIPALRAVKDEARAFFAQPMDAKRTLSRSRDNPWGYYDRELTKTVRDKKEIFDIGPDVAADPAAFGNDPFAGRTPWPKAGAFGPVMRGHFTACEQLSQTLVRALCLGLGSPADRLAEAFTPTSTSYLRLNYYPVADPLAGEQAAGGDLGIHHHTDAGAVTVLLQDDIPGLQVYRDGAWYGVEPRDDAFVINIGDMVQVWSNDIYRAPIHRVLAMETADRYSFAFFSNPAYEATVAPLPETVTADRPARYQAFSWGEFRRKRADGDFADYGTETQISDYRV